MSNNKKSHSDSNSEQNQQSQQSTEESLKIPRVPSDQRERVEKGGVKSNGLTKKKR